MDEITPLVTGVKYYSIYIPLTERNYAVSYRRKILQNVYYAVIYIPVYNSRISLSKCPRSNKDEKKVRAVN